MACLRDYDVTSGLYSNMFPPFDRYLNFLQYGTNATKIGLLLKELCPFKDWTNQNQVFRDVTSKNFKLRYLENGKR